MTIAPAQAAAPIDLPGRTPESGSERRVKRLLMLTHRLPYPPDRGDRIRSWHLLKTLSKHFTVDIACTSEENVWLQHHQLLASVADRALIQPLSRNASRLRGVAALVRGGAVTPACHYRPGMAQQIRQWHEQKPFDAVLTFCTGMIEYARLLTLPPHRGGMVRPDGREVRHILDLVDVDSIKWRSYARDSWAPMRWVFAAEARRLARIEAGKYDRFDAITVVSDAEVEAYRGHVGEHPNLVAVRNGVDLDYFSPLPDSDSRTLVFVGVLNYRPNAEGVTWFARKVFPKLRQRIEDAKFLIVGRHPTPRIEELGDIPGVEVVGSVPDVREYLRRASVAIAPLLLARGVQNKVLEAMSCERAVVCSPQAAEGVEAIDDAHLCVADQPEAWVDQIERLFTDSDRRRRIAAAARRHVEERHSWAQCLEPMVKLIAGE